MRISLEVFGIPSEATGEMRRTVYDSYERFLHRNGGSGPATTLGVRGGTCPLTGRNYLHVLVESPRALELDAIQRFADTIYASHPLREDEIVRANRSVHIEDSQREGADVDPLDPPDLRDEELSCWICSRFDGEEYFDHESGGPAILEVKCEDPSRIPLCAVCLKLLHDRRLIE
jgi:hypothetical protein